MKSVHPNKSPRERREALIKETHREFIVALFKACGYRTYLELGIGTGELVRMMANAGADVTWVDCEPKGTACGRGHTMTTDEFFDRCAWPARWDMIFIDADHSHVAVNKDLIGSMLCLEKGGTIILHDTDPARAELLVNGRCDTAWRMVDQLKCHEWDAVTLPVGDAGLTIVRPPRDRRVMGFAGDSHNCDPPAKVLCDTKCASTKSSDPRKKQSDTKL